MNNVIIERKQPHDIVIEDNASLDYVLISDVTTDISTSITLGSNSSIRFFDARFIKEKYTVNLDFFLNGNGAKAEIFGLYNVTENGDLELNIEQHHRALNTKSRAEYRGVIANRGKTLFRGLISINKDANGSEAFLENRNLLTSEYSKAHSIPSLEILSDDVRCSHAASVSSIEPEELFYLNTRGIGYEESRKMLIDGFLQKISKHFEPFIGGELDAKLTGDYS